MSSEYVTLKPNPGFCVKSTTLQAGSYTPSAQSTPSGNVAIEEPPSRTTISIPNGLKVFINIAWDHNVPPPPEGVEEAVKKAYFEGEDAPDDDVYVPVVVSDGRQDKDKG